MSNDTPPPQGKRRPRKKIDWTNAWVFAGAMTSGGFAILILATFLGAYYWNLLSPEMMDFVADETWPFVCLTYLISQIIPMIVRYQTQGWDVGIDQISTIIALLGTIAIFAGWAFGVLPITSAGWQIFFQTVLTHVADILLLLAGNKMIAAARGAEERRIN